MNEEKPRISDEEWAKMGAPKEQPVSRNEPPSGSGGRGCLWMVICLLPGIVGGGYKIFSEQQKRAAKEAARLEKVHQQATDAFKEDLASGKPSDITLLLAGIDPVEYHAARRRRGEALLVLAVHHNRGYEVDVSGIEHPPGQPLTTTMLDFNGFELAVADGNITAINQLIDEGASPDQFAAKAGELAGDEQWRMIHLAAIAGETDAVATLLERGADKTATLASGQTLLDIAVAQGHDELVEFLETGRRPPRLAEEAPSGKFWKKYGE